MKYGNKFFTFSFLKERKSFVCAELIVSLFFVRITIVLFIFSFRYESKAIHINYLEHHLLIRDMVNRIEIYQQQHSDDVDLLDMNTYFDRRLAIDRHHAL